MEVVESGILNCKSEGHNDKSEGKRQTGGSGASGGCDVNQILIKWRVPQPIEHMHGLQYHHTGHLNSMGSISNSLP